jgi:anti-sigma B factor antagonist
MPVSTLIPDVMVTDSVTVIALGPAFESIDETVLDSGIRQLLMNAVATADPPRVVLDLSHTTFFGSSFIEAVFQAWRTLSAKPGSGFAIAGLTSYCQEVLKITHLDTLWQLHPTREEAVRSLSAGARPQGNAPK